MLGVDYSPDDSLFASASSDHTVKLWDVGTRACLTTWVDSHNDQVWGVAFDPSGKRFASVGDDKAVVLYEARGEMASGGE